MEKIKMTQSQHSLSNKSFSYSFTSSRTQAEIFEVLLDVKTWWSGFYEETIIGDSLEIDDEFTFLAGGGVHFTMQRMIEKKQNSKILWLVSESKLSFLENTAEWTNTKFGFEIFKIKSGYEVTFTHVGLVPMFECFNNCSSAWTEYMDQLSNILK